MFKTSSASSVKYTRLRGFSSFLYYTYLNLDWDNGSTETCSYYTYRKLRLRNILLLGSPSGFNLEVKPDKCHFFKEKLYFLAHVIIVKSVATDSEKTRAIPEWAQITSETELRFFLGLASYYRRYVNDFASVLHHCMHYFLVVKRKSTSTQWYQSGQSVGQKTVKRRSLN